jgi:CRISPR-associated protein Cas2
MIAWVLYDIASNKARGQVAKFCKQTGLHPVQLSCYLGTTTQNDYDALALQIKEVIDLSKDKVYLFQLNKAELKATVQIGQAFDPKLITDEIKLLFI